MLAFELAAWWRRVCYLISMVYWHSVAILILIRIRLLKSYLVRIRIWVAVRSLLRQKVRITVRISIRTAKAISVGVVVGVDISERVVVRVGVWVRVAICVWVTGIAWICERIHVQICVRQRFVNASGLRRARKRRAMIFASHLNPFWPSFVLSIMIIKYFI